MPEQTNEHAPKVHSVGVIGARGYVGAELIRLIYQHPRLELSFASSRQLAGESINAVVSSAPAQDRFINISLDEIKDHHANVYFLALPNGHAAKYVAALEDAGYGNALIIDLSADFRFDNSWTYGLPEHDTAHKIKTATRIANPGCYATTVQLAVRPLIDHLAATPPCAFGVSGYSGAGTTSGPRNDPEQLRDNIIPYALTDHLHEREISHQLGLPVRFTPHVAAFFRGISNTTMLTLQNPLTLDEITARYESFYQNRPFVQVHPQAIPLLRDNVKQHHGCVGGFAIHPDDPTRLVVISTIDNLLKGAASQALQNLNLALGFDESEGLTV